MHRIIQHLYYAQFTNIHPTKVNIFMFKFRFIIATCVITTNLFAADSKVTFGDITIDTRRHVRLNLIPGNDTEPTYNKSLAILDLFAENKIATIGQFSFSHVDQKGFDLFCNILEKNTTLQTLGFNFHPPYKVDAKRLADALAKNTTLKTLGLASNQITNYDVQNLAHALAKNTTLETLYFTDNNIDDRGLPSLADMIIQNSTITTLALDYNKITDASTLALAVALTKNTTLKALKLDSNKITNENQTVLKRCASSGLTITF